MEKGILPGVFCSSIVAVLATAIICSLVKLSCFVRCYRSSCSANASVGFNDLENIILLSSLQRRNFSSHSPQLKHSNASRGVSLIEVLVTLVVLSIGLLGMAAMQVRAMQINQGAYMRSQAVGLSQDMADRLRINWEEAKAGNYDLVIATGSDAFADVAGDSDQLKLAKKDIRDWLGFIQASLPEGDGSIIKIGDRFTITVCWDDNRDPGNPAPSLPCGADGLESNVLEVTL